MGERKWLGVARGLQFGWHEDGVYNDNKGQRMRRAFIEGRSACETGMSGDELSAMEFVPDLPLAMHMLPSSKRAKVKKSDSAETAFTGEPDVDCASENIQVEEEKDLDARDHKVTSNDTLPKTVVDAQGALKETGPTASDLTLIPSIPYTATLVTDFIAASLSLDPAFAPTKSPNLPSSNAEDLDLEMAGRGRGAGVPGQLKNITWEPDKDLKLNSKPSELFPAHPNLKAPKPATEQEQLQVKHYKSVRNRIHRGPLYTQPTKRQDSVPSKVFSEEQYNAQYTTDSKADMDPFNGVETYSQRMAGKTNTIPKLSGRPFDLKLFPKELWSTLEGKEGDAVREHLDLAAEKQRLKLNGTKDPAAEARITAMMEKIHKIGDEEDEEEEIEEADQDSEFDDDDMGGDYDGEQYFDNGEEDGEDGDGGGGGEEY